MPNTHLLPTNFQEEGVVANMHHAACGTMTSVDQMVDMDEDPECSICKTIKEAWQNGWRQGYEYGYDAGWHEAWEKAWENGWTKGWHKGWSKALQDRPELNPGPQEPKDSQSPHY